MESKLITFIIPCYNAEKTIDRCINSIINQSVEISSLQIIIVDDASTDTTREKVREWANKTSCIELICCGERGLQGKARNIGLARARGDYIGFIDADDWIEPNTYEELSSVIMASQADMINYLYSTEDEKYNQPPYEKEGLIWIFSSAEREHYFSTVGANRCCWNKLIRRELVEQLKLRFAEGVFDEESLFLTPAFIAARNFYNINKPLYHYCLAEGGSTSQTVNSALHKYDNELTWLQTYDKLVSLNAIALDRTLIEFFFVINYFFYSIIYSFRFYLYKLFLFIQKI